MSNRHHKIIFIIAITYIIIVSIFLFWHRVGFSPDQFFGLALIITLILGKTKKFIRDWSLPVVLFLGYDYLRGLVPKLSLSVNIFPMIDFDKQMFGEIPSIFLQTNLFSTSILNWYDYLATIFYMSHFIVPMVVAFLFWIYKKKFFEDYTVALILLSYTAFITYILYPAMPPWMASQEGFIPQVHKIMDKVFISFPKAIDLPSVYRFFGANLVAAVPSLHAAYPWLTFLFLSKISKKFGLPAFIYVLGVWYSIVYLGEHYVFDILIGVLYASIIFLLISNASLIWKKISLHFKVEKISNE